MRNWERHFRAMKPRPLTDDDRFQFGGILLADNLNAVNAYFHRVVPVTDAAKSIVHDWAQWWVTTGDPANYTFLVPNDVWDEARNRKLAFDRANATTPEQKAAVERVALTGMTTETAQGEADRRDPLTGEYFVPPKPILPKWFWPVVVGSLVVGVGLPVLRKVLLPL